MTVRVDCGCGHAFDADASLVGGITNCPRCGRATEVNGLNDPAWRALQIGAVLVGVTATALTWQIAGAAWALVAAAGLAGFFWLLTRAL